MQRSQPASPSRPPRSARRVLWALAALGCSVASGVRGDEAEVPRTLFQEATEVAVINVDVVVLDAAGQPVTGLDRDAFEVRENGRRVEIINFYAADRPAGSAGEVTALAAADPAAHGAVATGPETAGGASSALSLLVYIDSAALEPRHRAAALGRVRDIVLGDLPPGARVMVVGAEGEPVVYQPLTGAPIEVVAALDRLESQGAPRSANLEMELRDVLRAIGEINVEAGSGYLTTKATEGYAVVLQEDGEEGIQEAITDGTEMAAAAVLPQIRAYAAQQRMQVVTTVGMLRGFLDLAAGLPGRKALLYVGDALTARPGGALFDALQERLSAMPNLAASSLAGAEGEDLTPLFRELALAASSAGVAVYTLDPGTESFLERGSAAEAAGAGGNFSTWRDSLRGDLQRDREDRLIQLAQDTGGRFSGARSGDEDLARGLAHDFTHYYSLGYPADPALDPATVREVEVRVPNPQRTVHHRRRFRAQSLVERSSSRTRAALVVPGATQGLAFDVSTEPAVARDDGTFVVPVRVAVPLGDLVLLPGPAEHRARVSLFVAARDARGRMSDVERHACPIRIANRELLTAMGRSAVCGVRLQMRGGPQRLAVSVLDELAAVDGTRTIELEVGGDVSAAESR